MGAQYSEGERTLSKDDIIKNLLRDVEAIKATQKKQNKLSIGVGISLFGILLVAGSVAVYLLWPNASSPFFAPRKCSGQTYFFNSNRMTQPDAQVR